MTLPRLPVCWLALALGLLLQVPTGARGHELPADRLTLVQRDATHLGLQLYVDLPALIHRSLAPQTPVAEFMLALSSQSQAEIESALRALRARVESGLKIRREDELLSIAHWRWPSAARVQALLQQRAMQLVVTPNEHAHDDPEEITADVVAPHGIGALSLELPNELKPLMLVNYRPRQRWIDRSSGTVPLTF